MNVVPIDPFEGLEVREVQLPALVRPLIAVLDTGEGIRLEVGDKLHPHDLIKVRDFVRPAAAAPARPMPVPLAVAVTDESGIPVTVSTYPSRRRYRRLQLWRELTCVCGREFLA